MKLSSRFLPAEKENWTCRLKASIGPMPDVERGKWQSNDFFSYHCFFIRLYSQRWAFDVLTLCSASIRSTIVLMRYVSMSAWPKPEVLVARQPGTGDFGMCGSQRSSIVQNNHGSWKEQKWPVRWYSSLFHRKIPQFSIAARMTFGHMHRTVERMELDIFQTHDNFSPQSGQSKFLNFSGLDLGYGNGTGTVFAFNGKCLWFVPVQGNGVGSFITIWNLMERVGVLSGWRFRV